MLPFIQYFGKYQSVRGGLGGMPFWGRLLLVIFSSPGLVMIAAGVLVAGVGIGVMVLMTVPIYRLIGWLRSFGRRPSAGEEFAVYTMTEGPVVKPVKSGPRRQVDVRIIE